MSGMSVNKSKSCAKNVAGFACGETNFDVPTSQREQLFAVPRTGEAPHEPSATSLLPCRRSLKEREKSIFKCVFGPSRVDLF